MKSNPFYKSKNEKIFDSSSVFTENNFKEMYEQTDIEYINLKLGKIHNKILDYDFFVPQFGGTFVDEENKEIKINSQSSEKSKKNSSSSSSKPQNVNSTSSSSSTSSSTNYTDTFDLPINYSESSTFILDYNYRDNGYTSESPQINSSSVYSTSNLNTSPSDYDSTSYSESRAPSDPTISSSEARSKSVSSLTSELCKSDSDYVEK